MTQSHYSLVKKMLQPKFQMSKCRSYGDGFLLVQHFFSMFSIDDCFFSFVRFHFWSIRSTTEYWWWWTKEWRKSIYISIFFVFSLLVNFFSFFLIYFKITIEIENFITREQNLCHFLFRVFLVLML